MRKKLTITLAEDVYEGLHNVVPPRKIAQFIENLVKPHVVRPDLDRQYKDMAKSEEEEREAIEWAEAVIGDIADEAG